MMIKYDFSVASDYEKAIKIFGGHDRIKERYPHIMEALENTRKQALSNSNAPTKAMADGVTDFHDLVDSTRVSIYGGNRSLANSDSSSNDPAKFSTTSKANYRNTHDYLLIQGRLSNLTTGRTLGVFSEAEFDSNCIAKTIESSRLEATEGVDLLSESTFTVMDTGPDGQTIVNVVEVTERMLILSESVIENIKIEDPKPNEEHSSRPKTKIVYQSRTDQNADYTYQHIAVKYVHGIRCVDTTLPFKGSITVNDKHTIDEKYFLEGFSFELSNALLEGVVEFKNISGITYGLSKDKRTLTWEFPTDWKTLLKLERFGASGVFELELDAKIKVKNNKLGKTFDAYVFIPTIVGTIDPAPTDKFKPLHIVWGCLGKDTMIRMDDGSQKKIDTISDGDMVLTQSGTPKKVIRITAGIDNEVVVLQVEGHPELLLSYMHPIVTERGVIEAHLLNASDRIQLKDGSFADLIYLDEIEYNDKVFSLVLESPDFISANGYWVGDADSVSDGLVMDECKVASFLDENLISELKAFETDMRSAQD